MKIFLLTSAALNLNYKCSKFIQMKNSKQKVQPSSVSKGIANPHVICCGKWEKFTGQVLETNDLLWTKDGLAFVDSGYTDKTPSRISSMPEAWSFSFENGGINQRTQRGDADEYILPNGTYYWTHISGRSRIGGHILFMCRVSKP